MVNLKSLSFANNNYILGHCLYSLTKLTHIDIQGCDYVTDNDLINLVNIEHFTVGSNPNIYGNCLNSMKNLKTLEVCEYTKLDFNCIPTNLQVIVYRTTVPNGFPTYCMRKFNLLTLIYIFFV